MQGPLVIIVGLLVFWVAVSGRASRVGEAWDILRGRVTGGVDSQLENDLNRAGELLPQSDRDLLDRVRRRREQIESDVLPRLIDPATYHMENLGISLRRDNPYPGGTL
jgi:hypothetical protein